MERFSISTTELNLDMQSSQENNLNQRWKDLPFPLRSYSGYAIQSVPQFKFPSNIEGFPFPLRSYSGYAIQ